MKYLSLFSGIGGFELGIQQAYVETIAGKKNGKSKKNPPANEEARNRLVAEKGKTARTASGRLSQHSNGRPELRQPTCVGYSEIDEYAIKIYERHHYHHTNYGDITKIKAEKLPDFDFLCGGFPCQAFSIAGKRRGFEDTRGTLFFDIARILRAKKPRLFLLENVKGLLSHANGNTFRTIIATLDELGYDLQWQVLNSKNFGVPQNRERIFIVGHLRGTARPKVFPFQESEGLYFPEVAGTITATSYKGVGNDGTNYAMREITRGVSDAQRIYSSSGLAKTLKGLGGGLGAKTGLYQLKNMDIRRLTPMECERLQGFPDLYTTGMSDTQRYKMLGNAVTVNVIKAIMKKLL